MNVLITCCLGDYVKSDVDILKESYEDVFIVGVDSDEMIVNHVGIDKFIHAPITTSKMYVDFLLDVCRKESIDVLIPTSALDVEVIYPRINDFECVVTIGKTKGTMIANNKWLFCDFSAKHRIKIPRTECIKPVIWHKKSVFCAYKRPCIAKKAIGKGTEVFFDKKEVKKAVKKEKMPFILQEYLTGAEYSCICLCKKGEVTFSSVALNKKMDGSTAKYATIVCRKDIQEICEHACNELMLDGLVEFDLVENEKNEAFIIECNPRITATASLTVKAGVNVIKMMIDYFVNGHYDDVDHELEYGTSIMRVKNDMFFKEV